MILALSKTKNKLIKGFTLIELLVVIAIIGILSGLIIVSLNGANASAQDARTRAGVDSLRKTILAYGIHSGGVYPIELIKCVVATGCPTLSSALVPDYYSSLPADTNYNYISTSGTDFTVSGTLSNSDTYSYTASTGFSTTPSSGYASTCAAATISGVIECAESYDGSYVINTFTIPGTTTGTTTWEVPVGVTEVEYLVVAGGGGTQTATVYGGGGGAGGLLSGLLSVTPSLNYTVTVGNGGNTGSSGRGGIGGNSIFSSINTMGGGGGSGSTFAGVNGGSGGGGSNNGLGGTNVSGQGYPGGQAGGGNGAGGGGGGATNSGSNGVSWGNGGNGGAGFTSSITGTPICYAGGGGGSVDNGASGGTAICGGGNGRNSSGGSIAGADGLGGGAGSNGKNGGSGVVIIRYLHP
jgi:prepilin-type N-terminal cleavage/methylation domain-containing protein